MYELLKKILPNRLLIANEKLIRYILSFFYLGNKYQCNICSAHLSRFINAHDNTICPRCGSLDRNRRLWDIMQKEILSSDLTILDFSPSRCLYRKFKSLKNIRYVSSDFAGEFIADKKYDITHISEADNTFDLIICYHILEHIISDETAMKELYRVLKQGGKCFIQTPFKKGEIFEDINIIDSQERRKNFGQEDHVRVYSVAGLADRLRRAGFKIEISEFKEQDENYFGFKPRETVLIAKKES